MRSGPSSCLGHHGFRGTPASCAAAKLRRTDCVLSLLTQHTFPSLRHDILCLLFSFLVLQHLLLLVKLSFSYTHVDRLTIGQSTMALSRLGFGLTILAVLINIQVSHSQQDPLNDFCRRFGHQTAIVDQKLYIDGGLLNWNPMSQNPLNYTSKIPSGDFPQSF